MAVPSPLTGSLKPRTLALLVFAVAAALLLVPLPNYWRGLWQSKVLDLSHVPLFAALTWALWWWLGPGLGKPVVIVCVFAALTEVLQEFVGRTGSVDDCLRGVCGSLAMAAGIFAGQRRRSPLPLVGSLALAAGSLVWPLVDAVPWLVDAYEGAEAFPTLSDFHTERELLRWRCRQADLTRVRRDDGWAGRVTFFPGSQRYSYAALRPICRDFHAYESLACSFTVEGDPVQLAISLRSGSGSPEETTHYQVGRLYPPGKHVARFELKSIAPKAEPYPLDLADVWIIQFFVDQPREPHTLYLHRLWLESS